MQTIRLLLLLIVLSGQLPPFLSQMRQKFILVERPQAIGQNKLIRYDGGKQQPDCNNICNQVDFYLPRINRSCIDR